MDKESLQKRLEDEGFRHIYEWHDEPNTKYQSHAHKGKVAMYILEGGLVFHFGDKVAEFKQGDRIDVPVGATHTAQVGPTGCTFLVGEMIEGDS